MKLLELVLSLKEKKIFNEANPEIAGLAYDSREVQPGYLFACIRGTRQDGHAFAKNAVNQGASALLVEEPLEVLALPQIVVPNSREALASLANFFYENPTKKLKLVGVTGTNGKTTTTYLCESIFQEAGYKTGIIGTIHYKIGEKVLECKNTTPESLELFQLFKEMVDAGVKAAAMEVSSHALDQGRIHGVLYDAVVFTNLTQDHLDYHKTMEDYFQAKAKLFTKLLLEKNPAAVINADDPYGQRLLARVKIPRVSYGISSGEIQAKEVKLGWKGVSFIVDTPKGEIPIQLKLSGKFNVYNALAAFSTGFALGISLPVLKSGLEKASQVRGRFELVEMGQDFAVVVDYAHTPDGLFNLLQSAKSLTKGKLIVVFGCGGDRDRGKRPQMGKIADELGDYLVITSDNPRSEEPVSIIREIEAGVKKEHHVDPDRKNAIGYALSLAKPGDCVVIAGKGHETYQIFKDKTIHFDDREVAESFLMKMAPRPR